MAAESGMIKRLVRDRGFGFVTPDNGGEDLFFHRSAVHSNGYDRLNEGQRVTFTVGSGAKGPRAEDVVPQ